MKEYYKLEGTCTCEIILTNDINEVVLPIKKFDMEKGSKMPFCFIRKIITKKH